MLRLLGLNLSACPCSLPYHLGRLGPGLGHQVAQLLPGLGHDLTHAAGYDKVALDQRPCQGPNSSCYRRQDHGCGNHDPQAREKARYATSDAVFQNRHDDLPLPNRERYME